MRATVWPLWLPSYWLATRPLYLSLPHAFGAVVVVHAGFEPGTPLARLASSGRFELPDVAGLLAELRTFVDEAAPTDALFRTNHASNYLPLARNLPADRDRIVATIDAALEGRIPLRPEWGRGL